MSPPKKSYTILIGTSSKGQASIAFQPGRPFRILIVRSCAIGDFVLNIPTLRALSHLNPDARFTLVGYPAALSLASLFIPLEAVHSIDVEPWSRLFLEPNSGLYFDEAFVWSKSLTVAKHLAASGVSRVYHANPFPEGETHAAAHLLQALGLEPPDLPDLWEPQTDRILIHPGSGSARKCWPHFERLAAELPGVAAIIGPCEEDLKARIDCPKLEGLTLMEVASELRRCRLFIGNDSGITHLAAYLGCPTIALFGPTDPRIWGPVGRRVNVLRKSSLADISPAQVKAQAMHHL